MSPTPNAFQVFVCVQTLLCTASAGLLLLQIRFFCSADLLCCKPSCITIMGPGFESHLGHLKMKFQKCSDLRESKKIGYRRKLSLKKKWLTAGYYFKKKWPTAETIITLKKVVYRESLKKVVYHGSLKKKWPTVGSLKKSGLPPKNYH